jgi:heme iron utilization protein
MTTGNMIYKETQKFFDSFQTLLMATVSRDGAPNASYAPFIRDGKKMYIYTSELAIHTSNIEQTRKLSILFIENEKDADQLFARKRLTFDCQADVIERDSREWTKVMDIFEEKFGDVVEAIRPFKDFKMFCITPTSGLYVKGFGKAYRISGKELKDVKQVTGAHE